MRNILLLMLLVVASFPLVAEEEAPAKRRPRIRVYDQSADVVSVERRVEENRSSELELDKKIRNDIGAPGSLNIPVNSISLLPEMQNRSQDTRSENSDEEEESWVTPMDFLLEEDQMEEELVLSVDEEDSGSQELEITDWEALQKSMIEEALQAQEPEITDEEMEEVFSTEGEEDSINTSTSGGLEMAEIAPLQDLQSQEEDRLPSTLDDPGQFVPILQSARQMNGEVIRPARERNSAMELSGSMGLLNDLKEKWNRSPETVSSRSSNSFDSPSLPRERMASTSLPSMSLVNPAIRALPDSTSSAIPVKPSGNSRLLKFGMNPRLVV